MKEKENEWQNNLKKMYEKFMVKSKDCEEKTIYHNQISQELKDQSQELKLLQKALDNSLKDSKEKDLQLKINDNVIDKLKKEILLKNNLIQEGRCQMIKNLKFNDEISLGYQQFN